MTNSKAISRGRGYTSFLVKDILSSDFGCQQVSVYGDDNFSKINYSHETADDSNSGDSISPGEETGWPAWVYCTRYSDRPSSGPRIRKSRRKMKSSSDKRPRTSFTNDQLRRLKQEFDENRYLTEDRRRELSKDLELNEAQVKIWFQNKRAKTKKANGYRNPLAIQLFAQGLYNHSVKVKEQLLQRQQQQQQRESDQREASCELECSKTSLMHRHADKVLKTELIDSVAKNTNYD